jgi:flagellin
MKVALIVFMVLKKQKRIIKMSVRIQNQAMTQVKRHDAAKQTASARLASGQQINRASEGAAELSASTALKSTVRASAAALSNANRAVALGQVADGAMSQIGDLLLRMKELTVAANSDTFGAEDRTAANAEFAKLGLAITEIANTTRYAGTEILNAVAILSIQTSEKADDVTTYETVDLTTAGLAITGDVNSVAGAAAAQEAVDAAITALASARAQVGAFMVGLESTIGVNQVKIENLEAAISVFTEADLAKEATNLAMADIRGQMAQSMITKENQAAANITGLVR